MHEVTTHQIGEQRYRVLIDNAPEPIVILDVDTGQFVDLNKSAIELFKYSEDELLTMGPWDISPGTINGHDGKKFAILVDVIPLDDLIDQGPVQWVVAAVIISDIQHQPVDKLAIHHLKASLIKIC